MWAQLWNFMEWAYITYNLMTDDRFYSVYDDGKSVEDGIRVDSYTIVSRVTDDEDFIDAIAIKECPFGESEYCAKNN